MKYLYWLIGLVVLGGIGFGSYYLGSLSTDGISNTADNTIALPNDQSVADNIDLPDMSGINLPNNSAPTVPITTKPTTGAYQTPSGYKAFTNAGYGFAFDYPSSWAIYANQFKYPLNSYKHSGSVLLTSDRSLVDYDYQGPLPDTAKDVLIQFDVYGGVTQSLDAYITEGNPDDPYVKKDVSNFAAVNVTGKQYYWHKSTDPEALAASGVNYDNRIIAFKVGDKVFSFWISGNPTLREKVVKSFRTL
jgi:hypothetical protein